MGPFKCLSCGHLTAAYDGRTGKIKCYAMNCSWYSPEGYMVHCPVCHSDQIERLVHGSYCKRCGTQFAYKPWNGEK